MLLPLVLHPLPLPSGGGHEEKAGRLEPPLGWRPSPATAALLAVLAAGRSSKGFRIAERRWRGACWRGRAVRRYARGNEVVQELFGNSFAPKKKEAEDDMALDSLSMEDIEELAEDGMLEMGPTEEELRLKELKGLQEKIRERIQKVKKRKLGELKDALSSPEVRGLGLSPCNDVSKNWHMVLLSGSGSWYYHDTKTGQRTWSAPPGAPTIAQRAKKAMLPGQPPVASTPALPEGWQLVLNLRSGSWYYYDEDSAASSWESPDGLSAIPDCPPEPPEPWRRVLHVSANEWCYHNETTGETSWDVPQPEPEYITEVVR